MKLYYSPGACSLASHISLIETGLKFDLEQVDLREKKTKSGKDFKKINSKGQVPCLETQAGDVLTEGAAILQYIGDRAPEKDLISRAGTFERYQEQEWLNYVATEIHKTIGALFSNKSEEFRTFTLTALSKKLDWLGAHLESRKFLTGSKFTVADAYLFTILSWSKPLKIDLSKWPVLEKYLERVATRPATQQALKAEGLI